MHLLMILAALLCAYSLRFAVGEGMMGSWNQRWQRSLLLFLLSPLLLIMTAFAVLCMGAEGEMLWLKAGRFSYVLAVIFLVWVTFSLLKLAYQAWRSSLEVRTYPQQEIEGQPARILNTSLPYSAQIGFWQPELIISEGLLNTLDTAHLRSVLAHEQAHYLYRDTFWFFWLGWLRSCTAWLPKTDLLWQDLLLLREIRADAIAASQTDPLILAESLLTVASAPIKAPEPFCAAFSCSIPRNRLAERIDALLSETPAPLTPNIWLWSWLLFVFLPLIAIPFHR